MPESIVTVSISIQHAWDSVGHGFVPCRAVGPCYAQNKQIILQNLIHVIHNNQIKSKTDPANKEKQWQ